MKRKKNYLSWQLDPKDPVAIPNARVTLALLRCVRKLPGSLHEHRHDDFGVALAPVMQRNVKELRQALEYHQAHESKPNGPLSIDPLEDGELLQDRAVLTLLGLAASKRISHFEGLFDKTEKQLQSFVDRHSHGMDGNIRILAEMLSLPQPEQAFLRLAVAMSHGTIDRSLFGFVDSMSLLMRVVNAVCGAGDRERLRMFDATHPLARSGLLEFSRSRHSRDLDDMLVLSSVGQRLLSTAFTGPQEMSLAVLEPVVPSQAEAPLAWPHLADQQALLQSALRGALRERVKGFNVLIHGAPGTGKTEFVRQLLGDIGAAGFQVTHMDERGEEASRADRIASLHLSQNFAGHHERAVLVFDEAEDIFTGDYNNPLARLFKKDGESKAWMNHLLESNSQPVVWICNQVQHLDPAYLRRFAYCLEFPQAPMAQRLRIAQEQLLPLGCAIDTIERLAASEVMTPALVDSAARLARLTQEDGFPTDRAVQLLAQGHAQVMGKPAPRRSPMSMTRFDARYLNLVGGMTVDRLVDALQGDGCANVLFYGPPGTGKTQLAAQLAKQLGRRLVTRTASDLNSKWYGQSESNVAQMFQQCDTQSEVLFLDEADTLLSARDGSGHRTDRAVTAEFLRWMEAFDGVFICATNHSGDLDRALMRRFAYRLGFEPLTQSQRMELLAELALNWNRSDGTALPEVSYVARLRLQTLDQLTAGDFANVARRLKRALGAGVEDWLDELEDEHGAKGQATSRRIGFV